MRKKRKSKWAKQVIYIPPNASSAIEGIELDCVGGNDRSQEMHIVMVGELYYCIDCNGIVCKKHWPRHREHETLKALAK